MKVFKWIVVLAAIGFAVLAGVAAKHFNIGNVNALVFRVERKLGKIAGAPSETQKKLSLIETVTLRLRGTVYEMPQNDWIRGGGMTVWGDDLVVVTRTGRILRLIDGTGLVETPVETPPNGLADYQRIAGSDAFAAYTHKPHMMRYNDITYVETPERRGLALSYTFFDEDRLCYGSRVAWLDLAGGAAGVGDLTAAGADWEVIFETTPCLELNPGWTALDGMMAGGRMAFKAPATLYLGSGEYHLDGVHTYDGGIQDDASDYGKVIAIDLANRSARHVSKGHRNMQGVTLDKAGRLWVTEHGVRGGDELNLIEEGENYGWPLETLGTLYSGQPWPTEGEDGRHILHRPPVYAWLPSAAVSALATIDGFHPTWDGDLLAGSLSSPVVGQSLFRIRIRGERVVFVERIRLEKRVRYIQQYGADRIAVWFDSNELAIFEIEEREDYLADALADAEPKLDPGVFGQVRLAMSKCSECHAFVKGVHGAGPSLSAVIGEDIATTSYPDYSSALLGLEGAWTEDSLKAFLSDPAGSAAGTSMPDPGLDEGPVLDGVVEVFKSLSTIDRKSLPYN